MFRQPEEWLMAVLAVIWVGIHYFLAGWATAASAKYTLMITFFHALLALLAFLLWQRDKVQHILPLLLGLWVLCWTPWLDWFMLRDIVPAADGSVLLPPRPWYALWWFKLLLVLVPVVGGYAWQWKRARKRKMHGLI